jgi:hypothetical protein
MPEATRRMILQAEIRKRIYIRPAGRASKGY